jgi:hypothetical protein
MSSVNQQIDAASDAARPASRQGRWRYSLRSAIVAIAFVLVVLSHLKVTFDLRSARTTIARQTKELAELRDEVGLFEILDPSKPHVLAVRTLEPNAYRFRVYLPPRRKDYEICCSVSQIPATGLPSDQYEFQAIRNLSNQTVVPKLGGTFAVDVYVRKDDDGELRLWVRHPQGTMRPVIPATHLLAKDDQPQVWRIEPSSPPQAQVLDPHEPVVLLRWQACAESAIPATGEFPDGASDGVMVWIR